MKKLSIMFSNLRIRHKMLTVFLPLMIIPMLLFGLISYFIFQHNEVKKTIQDRMNSSYLIKQRIENVIQNTESCLDMITFYMNDLSGLLTEGSVGTTSEIDRKYAIENKLNFALLVFPDVKEAIFVDNQQRIYAANDRSITSANAKDQIQAYIDQLQETSGNSKGFEMTRFSFGNELKSQIVLPLGKKITEIKSGETLGELILFVSEDQISSLFEQMNDLTTSNFYLIDENHKIISSTDRSEVLQKVRNPVLNPLLQSNAAEGNVLNFDKQKIVYTKYPLNRNKWMILYQVSLDELMKDYQSLQKISLVVILLCSLVTVLVAVKLSIYIVGPIQRLIHTMRETERGLYKVVPAVFGHDEVGQLTFTYHRMTEHIRKLIDDIREEQRAKRKYELALMQQQIRPHFLYNTLDVVYTLAELGRTKEAKKATKALAAFYRHSLSGGNEIITVREEIEMIRNYLYIQHLRYKDEFDYTIRIPAECLDYRILKLTIQPLVENAIYHGLKPKREFGHLEITGYKKDGMLWIEVRDNGIGMSEEALRKLWTDPSQNENGSGFGLFSIDHRIKLYFGTPYGIELQSKVYNGTTIIVKIPLIEGVEAS
ncbi:MAG TPA: sensor histidine kinase [Candidatus Udaeobacter sp.]|nr:sensor histidine kinase [Candidatus Udaeobacter sp.]